MDKIEQACKNCPKKECWWGGFVGDCPINKKLREEKLNETTTTKTK